MTADGLTDLQANLGAQARAQAGSDADAFDRLDDELHHLIAEISGHEIAWALARRANGHLDRVRRLSLPDPDYIAEMMAEHHDLVAAIAEQDADGAESRMRHHLRMVLGSLPALQQEYPEFFDRGD